MPASANLVVPVLLATILCLCLPAVSGIKNASVANVILCTQTFHPMVSTPLVAIAPSGRNKDTGTLWSVICQTGNPRPQYRMAGLARELAVLFLSLHHFLPTCADLVVPFLLATVLILFLSAMSGIKTASVASVVLCSQTMISTVTTPLVASFSSCGGQNSETLHLSIGAHTRNPRTSHPGACPSSTEATPFSSIPSRD